LSRKFTGKVDMRITTGIAITVLAFACGPAMGAAMSKQDYQAAKKRIAAEYQTERQKCGVRYGNALDECVARAHAVRDVAKAELEAEYKPGPRTYYDAAIARAKAAYSVAKEVCDEKRGPEKKACMKDAKAAQERAIAEAKAIRAKG
jgi:hypothetical protein